MRFLSQWSPAQTMWMVGTLLGLSVVSAGHAQTLLHAYSLDASTLTLDGSNHITNASGVGGTLGLINGFSPAADATGRFGEAINFSAGRLDTSSFAGGSTALGSSFSISFWLKVGNVTSTPEAYVLQVGDQNGAQNAVIYGYNPGTVELFAPDISGASSYNTVRSASAITLSGALINTWTNVIYTYDGTVFKGFLNGAEVFSTNLSFSLIAAGGLSIGGSRNTFNPAANYFQGSLDDVAIYSGALSSGQILALQSASAIPEPATWAALAGVLACGVRVWRRRRGAA